MKYQAKDLKDIAKHLDEMAKRSLARLEVLRSEQSKGLRGRTREIALAEGEFHAYCSARDILKETELNQEQPQ